MSIKTNKFLISLKHAQVSVILPALKMAQWKLGSQSLVQMRNAD